MMRRSIKWLSVSAGLALAFAVWALMPSPAQAWAGECGCAPPYYGPATVYYGTPAVRPAVRYYRAPVVVPRPVYRPWRYGYGYYGAYPYGVYYRGPAGFFYGW